MTEPLTRSEIRQRFKEERNRYGGIRCHYCKRLVPKAKLYRVGNVEHYPLLYATCRNPACIEKAKASRFASEWLLL